MPLIGRSNQRPFPVLALLASAAVACFGFSGRCAEAPGNADQARKIEFFENKVRPLLVAHCHECHGADMQESDLRLDSSRAVMVGGASGPALVPGKPNESLLVRAIRYDGETLMPPDGKLSDAQIATLTKWVEMGAPWPAENDEPDHQKPTFSIDAEDLDFWSFRPVVKPPIPKVANSAWVRAPIDAFVLARLEAEGLKPVGPATRRAWLRRATYDLIGLPPTPEEIEAILADESSEAFAKVVDRLLASPHYGERWGRHWLDVARYAEDQAHTFKARLYPEGYRYRDWVVEALNEDVPYDRFLTEQIAGDLIEGPGEKRRMAALGLFALGPVYYKENVEAKVAEADEWDDRIDTLMRGTQGLTVACARCHDHKYDPISTTDYYALAGVFASTKYREFPLAPKEKIERKEAANKAVEARKKEIGEFLAAESKKRQRALVDDIARYLIVAWKLRVDRDRNPETSLPELAKQEGVEEHFLKRWAEYLAGADDHAHLAAWHALRNRPAGKADSRDEAVTIEQVRNVAQAFQEQAVLSLAAYDRREQGAEKTASTGNEAGSNGAKGQDDQVALVKELFADEGPLGIPRKGAAKFLPEGRKPAYDKLVAGRKKLEKRAKALHIPIAHSLTEGTPVDLQVFRSGNPERLGDPAPRGFPALFTGGERTRFATEGSGRLALARQITARHNPLTARVWVNRVWERHFGFGLVRSPGNFGSLGERPTHPLLLDHLAHQFMDRGWSIKWLHREIMLSATYRLASDQHATNDAADPANKLLWRMNRRRLEVEPWRDATLAVAGTLDTNLGGPSRNLADAANRRRTLYGRVSRHKLDDLLRLFDFPDPNITSAKRSVTTVALQQLFVLNSEYMAGQARALVERLRIEAPDSERQRIRRAYMLLFGRPATEREIALGAEFLAHAEASKGGEDKLPPWRQYALALLGSNEFTFVD